MWAITRMDDWHVSSIWSEDKYFDGHKKTKIITVLVLLLTIVTPSWFYLVIAGSWQVIRRGKSEAPQLLN